MKKLVLLSAAALLLSTPAFAQLRVDGGGSRAGGYRGVAERKLGLDRHHANPAAMAREAPLNVDGKGLRAGGPRGAMERKLGLSRHHANPAAMAREAPLNVDGKGLRAGGYRGAMQRKLGTEPRSTGSVPVR